MTLAHRILIYVKRHPGRTAWDISKALGDAPRIAASVSSLLKRLADANRLRREQGPRGSWAYFPRTASRREAGLCSACGVRPAKAGRRKCGRCLVGGNAARDMRRRAIKCL